MTIREQLILEIQAISNRLSIIHEQEWELEIEYLDLTEKLESLEKELQRLEERI